MRPEPAFWIAHPEGLNSVFLIGDAGGVGAGAGFLARKSRREAIYASGWFWFLVVGVGLTFAVPGFSMIFLIPASVFVIASAIGWLLPRLSLVAHGVACAFLLLIFFPLIKLVEVTMGLALAPVFGVLEALVIAPVLGLIGPLATGRRQVFVAVGAAFVMAAVATLFLPASSPAHPLALNFVAHYDMDARKAALLASAPPGALPQGGARASLTSPK